MPKLSKKASSTLALKYGIEWKFNTELAPWYGGVWERLVRSVKSSLRIMFKSCSETSVDFETILCQIEEIINKRPISYCNGNEDELLSLTPWNFLVIESTETPQNALHSNPSLISAFSDNNKLITLFWKRWKLEYLPTLVSNTSKATLKNIKVGDIVLLNEGSKREYWPLAKVCEVFCGRDGVVRSAKLKCRGKILTRPTKLIYLLESSNE